MKIAMNLILRPNGVVLVADVALMEQSLRLCFGFLRYVASSTTPGAWLQARDG
jgi:hypothetical protein